VKTEPLLTRPVVRRVLAHLESAPSRALLAPPEMLVTDRKQGLAALLDPAECSRLATPRQVA